jgi:hypothetical protein
LLLESFSGHWIFDPTISDLKPAPSRWTQTIRIERGQIQVHEEITRDNIDMSLEVEAYSDGKFYAVKGSPLVDEILYTFDGQSTHGTGRKQGTVSLREIVSLDQPDILCLSMRFFMNSQEIPRGAARFRRQ